MGDDTDLDDTIGEADVVRRAFDSLPTFIVAFAGPDHRYVAANAAVRTVFPAVRLGVPAGEIFPEFEGQNLIEILDRFLEQPPGELAVRVGLEEAHPAMKGLALIGMSVQLSSGLPAKVAVLGPMRMQYERAMAAVFETCRALESAQL